MDTHLLSTKQQQALCQVLGSNHLARKLQSEQML